MKIKVSTVYAVCATMSMTSLLTSSSLAQNTPAPNIALGKKVTATPLPSSGDTGNVLENLTDGNPENAASKTSGVALWARPTAVGWRNTSPACLVVDLGSVRPISGFSYHTAAGTADVTWPTSILMAVSDDEKNWRYAGELISMSAKHGKPPGPGAYHEYTFATHDAKTKGRYVAFGINSMLYTATDELEVFAGDDAWLSQPDETLIFPNQPEGVLEYMRALAIKQRQTERVQDDALVVQESINQSRLTPARKDELAAKLAAAVKLNGQEPLPGPDFKAIAPVNGAHRALLAVYGELLASQGYSGLSVWTQHRYSWLPLLAKPTTAQKTELDFSMLRNQFRSQALLLTNASGAAKTVRLKLNHAPKNAQSGWLKVDEVAWTDTHQGIMIADALLPATPKENVYSISIPAGMTRKVWFTIDSSKLPAGASQSSFQVEERGAIATVPLKLDIATIAMKRPRMSLGMWDDADSAEIGGGIGITMKNREAALKLMQSHYVDTAWGKRVSLPWPEAKDFDDVGNLTAKLDFTAFDRWIRQWPQGRRFYNFIHAGDSFAGTKMGTPEFNVRVGHWAKALAAHMTSLGFKPQQLGILIIDEQQNDAQDAIVANWATALKSGDSGLTIFADPVWLRPDLVKNQPAITQADVLCLNLPLYYRGGKPVEEYFTNLQGQGRELWFYQCTGPVRLFDPQRYYRYQAWHVYSINGTGQGFWSFGDLGSSQTSWNDYANSPYLSFTPAFLDVDTVNNSLHWDAVREGVTDFEELAMLRDAIGVCKDAKLRAEAQRVHDLAVKAVTSVWNDQPADAERFSVVEPYAWQSAGYNDAIADRQLRSVRAMLKRLR
jgi:hypothetical protein